MTHNPRRLLIIAIICAPLQFLLGAPSLSKGTGTVQDVSMVLQLMAPVQGALSSAMSAHRQLHSDAEPFEAVKDQLAQIRQASPGTRH
jgi:hypothetical protein